MDAITANVNFGSYNDRRYTRPWIARISAWPVGGKAEHTWGSYLGDSTGGTCEVACVAGDIIRYGQKDTRGNGTNSQYAVALADRLFCIDEHTAAGYFRASSERRAGLARKWVTVAEERAALMTQYEEHIAAWRVSQDRATYNAALGLERRAKEQIFSL